MYKILIQEPCFSLYIALKRILQVAGCLGEAIYASNEARTLELLTQHQEVNLLIAPAYWKNKGNQNHAFFQRLVTFPGVPPILLHSISHIQSLILQAKVASIPGYIFTDSEASTWIEAVKTVGAGGLFYPDINNYTKKMGIDNKPYLTGFEQEALGLLNVRLEINQDTPVDASRVPSKGFFYKKYRWGKQQLDTHWHNISGKYRT